jgi:cytochrome c5
MAQKDVPHIRPSEIKQIVLYLSGTREAAGKKTGEAPGEAAGESLVQQKCTLCHELDRVFAMRQEASAWRKTIDQMIENAEEIGITGFLTETQAEEIIRFLAGRK